MDSEPCWPLTPLFIPISSPIVDFLTTPKIFLAPPYFSFHLRLLNFFNGHYPFLTHVPTHDSFLCRKPLLRYGLNGKKGKPLFLVNRGTIRSESDICIVYKMEQILDQTDWLIFYSRLGNNIFWVNGNLYMKSCLNLCCIGGRGVRGHFYYLKL